MEDITDLVRKPAHTGSSVANKYCPALEEGDSYSALDKNNPRAFLRVEYMWDLQMS